MSGGEGWVEKLFSRVRSLLARPPRPSAGEGESPRCKPSTLSQMHRRAWWPEAPVGDRQRRP